MKKFGKKRFRILCALSTFTLLLFVGVVFTFAQEREMQFKNQPELIVSIHDADKTASKVIETVHAVEADTLVAAELAADKGANDYLEAGNLIEDEGFLAKDDVTEAMATEYNLGTGIYGFSVRDAYVLACCVSAEVGDQDYECLLAVANVIIHRGVSLGNCPGAIEEAVYQPYQFEVAYNSMQDFLVLGPQENAIAATQDALNGIDNVPGYKHFCYYTIMDDYLECDGGMLIGSEWFYY